MRARWISDRTCRATKQGNRYFRKIAGTRLGMLYFNLGALHHVGRRSGRLVKPFIVGPGPNKFIWLHRAESEQRPVLRPAQESLTAPRT